MTTSTTSTRPQVLPQIREAVYPGDTAPLVEIVREYVRWLDMDLSYRGFEEEMQSFEQTYTLPVPGCGNPGGDGGLRRAAASFE